MAGLAARFRRGQQPADFGNQSQPVELQTKHLQNPGEQRGDCTVRRTFVPVGGSFLCQAIEAIGHCLRSACAEAKREASKQLWLRVAQGPFPIEVVSCGNQSFGRDCIRSTLSEAVLDVDLSDSDFRPGRSFCKLRLRTIPPTRPGNLRKSRTRS